MQLFVLFKVSAINFNTINIKILFLNRENHDDENNNNYALKRIITCTLTIFILHFYLFFMAILISNCYWYAIKNHTKQFLFASHLGIFNVYLEIPHDYNQNQNHVCINFGYHLFVVHRLQFTSYRICNVEYN